MNDYARAVRIAHNSSYGIEPIPKWTELSTERVAVFNDDLLHEQREKVIKQKINEMIL